MSKWCPKCQRVNQKGNTCDFCGQALENTSNKNTLLKQILQEISDEHKENSQQYISREGNKGWTLKNNAKTNKNLEKIIAVVILIILAILFFLKPSIKTEQTELESTDKKTLSITKIDKATQKQAQEKLKAQQEQKETERIRKLLAVQKAEREKHQKEQKAKILIKKRSIENPKINSKQNVVLEVLNEETARAESKRRLLKEMQADNEKSSSEKEKDDPRAEAKRKLLEQMQFSR